MSKRLVSAAFCAALAMSGAAIAADTTTPTRPTLTPPAGFTPGTRPTLPAGVTPPARPTTPPAGFTPGTRPTLPAGVTPPDRPTRPATAPK